MAPEALGLRPLGDRDAKEAGRHPRGRPDRSAAPAHELLALRRPPRYPAFV